ncbi:hypothetical protein LZ554_000452 [Drepanopeziza brunnea f. sp. 'monogermtubi']|nr:hypothetical protein LZ554_000452 [Drepanopeziza brunnea f. sp. 'monogermtubi']
MRAINEAKPKQRSVLDAARLIAMGGDHTITLPILRALHSTRGSVAVLHFDSHLVTWDLKQLGGGLTKYSERKTWRNRLWSVHVQVIGSDIVEFTPRFRQSGRDNGHRC